MAKHKFQKALQRLSREIFNLFKRVSRQLMQWLLRSYLVLNRLRPAQAGFVLPTLALMMVVVFLVVAAVMFRTFSRNTQVIRDYQTQQVVNAATPALDRAKAKIEYLFTADPRLPAGVPDEAILEVMMKNDGSEGVPELNTTSNDDVYTYPGETRVTGVDFDGDGNADTNPNVWRYRDGTTGVTTVYGIAMRGERQVRGTTYTINPSSTNKTYVANDRRSGATPGKADLWLVRNGPLATTILNSNSACSSGQGSNFLAGWYQGNGTATLYKNFQVMAMSMPTLANGQPNTTNRSISTLQYQQDRSFDRGNKWGAWFRYDLEIYAGQTFRWNGAMHSQGSIFLAGASDSSQKFLSYLISSPNSCFFTPDTSSKITAFSELVTGRIRNSSNNPSTTGSDKVDMYYQDGNQAITTPITLNPAGDSVLPNSELNISQISTDPLRLLVLNEHGQRVLSDGRNWLHDNSFETDTTKIGSTSRVLVGPNAVSCAPYVDDTYRADNRMGPKPGYTRERQVRNPNQSQNQSSQQCLQASISGQGTDIERTRSYDTSDPSQSVAGADLVRDDPLGPDLPDTVGLDGFWERRARNEGMRIIVGQRLELGNPYGWLVDRDNSLNNSNIPTPNQNADLSIYPPYNGPSLYSQNQTSPAWAGTTRPNEARQLRTLQDNLAAVQATAIYHSKVGDSAGTQINEGGYFPVACLASTVHPGTAHTLAESATFQTLQIGPNSNPPTLLSNFFYGEGTNGWEFTPPQLTESNFAREIEDASSPLRRAVNNLARFAGDPNGAFPATQENLGGTDIHPYPNMTMWGDYSNLRRVMDKYLASGYTNLSIADKSYLHTAACTLGLLAYNISYVNSYDITNPPNTTDVDAISQNLPTTLTQEVSDLNDALVISPTIEDPPLRPTDPNGVDPNDLADFWISELDRRSAAAPADAQLRKNAAIARILHLQSQIAFDRAGPTTPPNCTLTGNLQKLCAKKAKFPALHYIFPTAAHQELTVAQETALQHNRDNYIRTANGATPYQALNAAEITEIAVTPREYSGASPALSLNQLGKNIPAAEQTWKLPQDPDTNDNNCNSYGTLNFTRPPASGAATPTNYIRTVRLPATGPTSSNHCVRVGFKDSAIFDGREMMSVRLFNLDLDLMRSQTVLGLTGTQQDTWLPTSGLVYAFREDAVREDAIARPPLMRPDDYARYRDAAGRPVNPATGVWPASSGNPSGQVNIMNVWATPTPLDPPKINEISPKSVDYYADPDRRPYGFRLRRGRDLRRNAPGFNVPNENAERGLSLISDNPVYIQGDFNLHTTNGTDVQEEFGQPLTQPGYDNFYTRSGLNPNFAKGQDWWRQSEIIADSITILSNQWYCDGTVQGGIRGDNTGCTNGISSYRNSNMQGDASLSPSMSTTAPTPTPPTSPLTVKTIADAGGYVCENPFDPRSARLFGVPPSIFAAGLNNQTAATPVRKGCDGPIKIFRNGNIRYTSTTGETDYRAFNNFTNRSASAGNQNRASLTTVNAVLVSGVVASRPNSTNGGLHNFPRLIEDWGAGADVLSISGSMLQLNFSNYATGPYDQETWEPTQTPTATERAPYYRVPTRRWGYDVALQITSAGPIARRMVVPALDRSEFYREPPADDPYICKLRKVVDTGITCN